MSCLASQDILCLLFNAQVYVKVNAAAEKDEEMKQSAQEFMRKLEGGHPQALSLWTHFRGLSIEEYAKVYKVQDMFITTLLMLCCELCVAFKPLV